jgi:hypothetical protein
MSRRFRTWNVGSMYRAGSLMTVLRKLSTYMLYSGGRAMAPNQQENTHFCIGRGMRIMN